jgi:hypothetical protein
MKYTIEMKLPKDVSKGVFMFKNILFMISLSAVCLASAKPSYGIGFYQNGKQAESIYKALAVQEQVEKPGFQNSEGLRTYKIGKNILCFKTEREKQTTTYFCSAGFDSLGQSDSDSTQGECFGRAEPCLRNGVWDCCHVDR